MFRKHSPSSADIIRPLAHAKGISDAKCQILSLSLNVMPPKFNYIHFCK